MQISSSHPSHVHKAWPRSIMMRIARLSPTSGDFDKAATALIKKYVMCNASYTTILWLGSARRDLLHKFYPKAERRHPSSSNPRERDTVVWLRMGYHPALRTVLRRALQRSPCPAHFILKVAWRNEMPTLQTHIGRRKRHTAGKHQSKGVEVGDCGGCHYYALQSPR